MYKIRCCPLQVDSVGHVREESLQKVARNPFGSPPPPSSKTMYHGFLKTSGLKKLFSHRTENSR